jgi:hypothetical protein
MRRGSAAAAAAAGRLMAAVLSVFRYASNTVTGRGGGTTCARLHPV